MPRKRDNSWDTDLPSTYSPDNLYTQSVDGKGHGDLLHVRMKSWITSKISQLVVSRKFGYKTPQDFVRDAIVHRLQYWAEREESMDDIDSILRHVYVMQDYLEEEQRRMEHEQLINDMTTVVNAHLASGAMEEARRIVYDMRQNADGIPNNYWRNRYLRTIEQRFGHLL